MNSCQSRRRKSFLQLGPQRRSSVLLQIRRFYQKRCYDEQQRKSEEQLMLSKDMTDRDNFANNETVSSIELNMNENISD